MLDVTLRMGGADKMRDRRIILYTNNSSECKKAEAMIKDAGLEIIHVPSSGPGLPAVRLDGDTSGLFTGLRNTKLLINIAQSYQERAS